MKNPHLLNRLREYAGAIPAEGAPVVQRARQLALQALVTVETAVEVDPTLTDDDRRRDIDLLLELLRQLKPLARQATVEFERRRLAKTGADEHAFARLGRTRQDAPDELAALSSRCTEIAATISAAALPDWNTPERIRERSERLLPPDYELKRIAGQLRNAVETSLSLPFPALEAVRLARLADEIVRP